MLKSNFVNIVTNISTNGVIAQGKVSLLLPGPGGISDQQQDMFDSGQYLIVTGAGVSAGAIGVNLLQLSPNGSPVWQTATTPNSATGAAFTLVATLGANLVYNGSLNVAGAAFFPCLGLQLTVSGLTGGNILVAQLTLTKR